MIALLLFAILLALVFPSTVRFLLTAALLLALVVGVAAVFEANDMARDNQLRDPGSAASRALMERRNCERRGDCR